MATVYNGGNVELLSGKVAILGFGSQGHAHALNLHDSGVDVMVGLREGSSSRRPARRRASRSDGRRGGRRARRSSLPPPRPGAAEQVYERGVARTSPGAALLFAHGFNVHYERICRPRGTT